MLYILYNPDGSIHQANRVYDPEPAGQQSYDELLNEKEEAFVKIENAPALLPPDKFYVDVAAKEVVKRPIMPITVSATVIKAGDEKNGAIFRNIPKGVTYAIYGPYDALIYPVPGTSNLFPATELELSIPMPCTYRVEFELWPYQKFSINIEAI